jgi:hypothetical protein
MQHQTGWSRIHNNVVNAKDTMDLIKAHASKGLPIPNMFAPADLVPPCNKSAESFFQLVFVFADDYLQDDSAIIVIHQYQVDAKSTILGYCVEYSFENRKEWLCMNCLHLCSPLNNTLAENSLPKSSSYIDASLNCMKLNCLPIV